jgi:hypothetical protein
VTHVLREELAVKSRMKPAALRYPVAVLLIFVSGCGGGPPGRLSPETTDPLYVYQAGDPNDSPEGFAFRSLARWMAFLKDEAALRDLALPGAHDAGSYSMKEETVPDRLAQTQTSNLFAQACAGVRYLDLRITMKGDTPTLHHGPISGRPLEQILETQIVPFSDLAPSEFLVLDFQELGGGSAASVTDLMERHLSPECLVPRSAYRSGLTLGEIRENGWNFMVFWESSAYDEMERDGTLPAWAVRRGGSNVSEPDEFLYSPYDERIYLGPIGFIPEYLNARMGDWGGSDRHSLFVAQAIKTNLLRPPLETEGALGRVLNGWVANLSADQPANIVMRDAVQFQPSVAADTIALNIGRGLIREESADRLSTILRPLGEQRPWHYDYGPQTRTIEYFSTRDAYEAGDAGLPGSVVLVDTRVEGDGAAGPASDFAFALPPGYVMTHFQIRPATVGGTDGRCAVVDDQTWVFSDRLHFRVTPDPSQGFSWSVIIRGARLGPSFFR